MTAKGFVSLTVSGALLSCVASAEIIVIKPGECTSAQESYLLAENAGAIIKVDDALTDEPESNPVIVFRPNKVNGWASQRILRRFDLTVEGSDLHVVNSGDFCRELK